MRDIAAELKTLKLFGMVEAWNELSAPGSTVSLNESRWLIEHLLQAEGSDRAIRSIRYQMNSAKFPVHRDLAGFDFESSRVDRDLIEQLANLSFTEAAQNVVFVGGTEYAT